MTKSKKILALVAFATLFVTMTMSCSNNKNIVAKHHCIDEGEDDDGVICCPVETQAVFPLEEGLYAYIEKNLKYPEAAKEANIEGKIAIEFIIEKDGSITNIKVRKDIGYGCGDEVVRILKEMPKWKPAMQRGKPVRFKYGKNIRFTLQKEE